MAAASMPRVEAGQSVYNFKPADNGAGPRRDCASPGLLHHKSAVYAAGLDIIPA